MPPHFWVVRLGQVRYSQVRLGIVRLGIVRLGIVRLGQVRLGQVQVWTRLGIGWVGLILNELYAGQDRVVHILRRAVSGGEKGQATMSCIWGSNVIRLEEQRCQKTQDRIFMLEAQSRKSRGCLGPIANVEIQFMDKWVAQGSK